MRGRSQGWRFPFAAVVLVLMAGCVNSKFVYKPNSPTAGGPKLPVKIAVLPFKDGTEDFTGRGSLFSGTYTSNLAKAGIGGRITALTPDLWAKFFADDMTASGGFQAVRFVYSPSEFMDEDFYIEGTLKKVESSLVQLRGPNKFILGFRALRRTDNGLVWEKEVAREWEIRMTLFDGCGVSEQCRADRSHADTNRVMQALFAEARTDLVATLASLSRGRAGEDRKDKEKSTPQDPDSVERTIDRIFKGK